LIQTAAETSKGRVPIVGGAGGGTTLAIRYAQEAERLGADVNAHTDKDHTAYHMRGLAVDAPRFVAMLGEDCYEAVRPEPELTWEQRKIQQNRRLYDEHPDQLWVLEEDGDVFGFVTFWLFPEKSYGHIDNNGLRADRVAMVSLAIVLDPAEQRASVAVAAPVPLPAPSPAPVISAERRTRNWKTPTGAGLAAVGAGLIAWGAIWIAIDGNDRCDVDGPACLTVYDTRTAGWILTAGGVAAAGAGAVFLYLGSRAGSSNVAIDITPTSLALHGRF